MCVKKICRKNERKKLFVKLHRKRQLCTKKLVFFVVKRAYRHEILFHLPIKPLKLYSRPKIAKVDSKSAEQVKSVKLASNSRFIQKKTSKSIKTGGKLLFFSTITR